MVETDARRTVSEQLAAVLSGPTVGEPQARIAELERGREIAATEIARLREYAAELERELARYRGSDLCEALEQMLQNAAALKDEDFRSTTVNTVMGAVQAYATSIRAVIAAVEAQGRADAAEAEGRRARELAARWTNGERCEIAASVIARALQAKGARLIPWSERSKREQAHYIVVANQALWEAGVWDVLGALTARPEAEGEAEEDGYAASI